VPCGTSERRRANSYSCLSAWGAFVCVSFLPALAHCSSLAGKEQQEKSAAVTVKAETDAVKAANNRMEEARQKLAAGGRECDVRAFMFSAGGTEGTDTVSN
jgi:hypothetical protein